MSVSSNSIIHYTKQLETLKLIMQQGFKLKFCIEDIKIDDNVISAAHPMISFCDIPLSNSKNHINAYGNYGIGLNKSWAKKNQINPVLYLEDNSLIAKRIYNEFKLYLDDKSKMTESQVENIRCLKAFTKNYNGNNPNSTNNFENYKFYDEREWRLIPEPKSIAPIPIAIKSDVYRKNKNKYNSELGNKIRIEFEPSDITYIIVEKKSDVEDLIKFIKNHYRTKYNDMEILKTLTKIISTEEINEDI